MTGPLGELERSLRAGPPDEDGYRPRPLTASAALAGDEPTRTVSRPRVIGGTAVRRDRATPPWYYLAAVLVVAVSFAALGIIGIRNQPGAGGPGSPSPSGASPSPSPQTSSSSPTASILVPPLTQTFVSRRNGFSVDYPDGWTVTSATLSWPVNDFLPYGHPALDTLARPGEARLMVASQALGQGQTEDEWLAAFFRPYMGGPACGGDRSTWPRLDVDGVSGYLDMADCPVPIDSRISDRDVGFDVLVFAGGRVYDIGFDGDVDLAYFKALLATLRLDPSNAVD
ncbi:MAG: hypothetical protein HYX54_00800 [Chloroflexi bacterium]|nr:hypothetical protein [Chloroflexota bacterium]